MPRDLLYTRKWHVSREIWNRCFLGLDRRRRAGLLQRCVVPVNLSHEPEAGEESDATCAQITAHNILRQQRMHEQSPLCIHHHCIKLPSIVLRWLNILLLSFGVRHCGAVVQRVRHLGLRSVGCGFNSCSRQCCVTTLGKLFTPMCLCHQAV